MVSFLVGWIDTFPFHSVLSLLIFLVEFSSYPFCSSRFSCAIFIIGCEYTDIVWEFDDNNFLLRASFISFLPALAHFCSAVKIYKWCCYCCNLSWIDHGANSDRALQESMANATDICHSLMLYRFLIKSGFQSVSPMKPLSIFTNNTNWRGGKPCARKIDDIEKRKQQRPRNSQKLRTITILWEREQMRCGLKRIEHVRYSAEYWLIDDELSHLRDDHIGAFSFTSFLMFASAVASMGLLCSPSPTKHKQILLRLSPKSHANFEYACMCTRIAWACN